MISETEGLVMSGIQPKLYKFEVEDNKEIDSKIIREFCKKKKI